MMGQMKAPGGKGASNPTSAEMMGKRMDTMEMMMLLVAAAVGGFYLVTEHTAHLFGVSPYLIILACPLIHMFMHRGHGHGSHGHRHGQPGSNDDEQRPG